MTPEEELLRQAHAAGVSPRESGAWTWGELLEAVEAERERRHSLGQLVSVLAYHHALLTARSLTGGRIPPVYDVFPFWTEEEKRALRLEQYRQIMQRHCSAGRKEKQA